MNLCKSKMRHPGTKVYVDQAIKDIKRSLKGFPQYQNKGIIKMRGTPLAWFTANEGKRER